MIKTQKKLLISIIVIFVLLCMAGALFFLRGHRSTKGIQLNAGTMIAPGEFPHYLQTDHAWAGDTLGGSAYTMKSSGCLTSCIAASLSAQRIMQGGSAITPGELNLLLSEKKVYNTNGDIVWSQLSAALPDADVYVAASANAKEIETYLLAGHYPIVKVKNHGSGPWHWVVLVGADERGYLCMNPLNEADGIEPLSAHGSRVYSMRAVSLK